MTGPTFAELYPSYRDKGYSVRCVPHGSKGPKVKGWNKPDADQPESFYEKMAKDPGAPGIALLLGTSFPDGTTLGALDVDHDDYVRVAHFMLGNPACGRVGNKGIAFPVRLRGEMKKARLPFEVKLPDGGKISTGELLGKGSVLALPPTIHPTTDRPYEWVGKPLLETSFEELPVIEV